jgi:hypothetical protein
VKLHKSLSVTERKPTTRSFWLAPLPEGTPILRMDVYSTRTTEPVIKSCASAFKIVSTVKVREVASVDRKPEARTVEGKAECILPKGFR